MESEKKYTVEDLARITNRSSAVIYRLAKNSADFQRSKKSSIEKLDARRNIERLTPLFFMRINYILPR